MHQHLHYSGPRKRQRRDPRKYLALTAENFPNMGKETVSQVQEAQRVPGRKEPEEDTETHNNQTDKD